MITSLPPNDQAGTKLVATMTVPAQLLKENLYDYQLW